MEVGHQAVDQAQQCGFPATAGAAQQNAFTRLDAKAHILQSENGCIF